MNYPRASITTTNHLAKPASTTTTTVVSLTSFYDWNGKGGVSLPLPPFEQLIDIFMHHGVGSPCLFQHQLDELGPARAALQALDIPVVQLPRFFARHRQRLTVLRYGTEWSVSRRCRCKKTNAVSKDWDTRTVVPVCLDYRHYPSQEAPGGKRRGGWAREWWFPPDFPLIGFSGSYQTHHSICIKAVPPSLSHNDLSPTGSFRLSLTGIFTGQTGAKREMRQAAAASKVRSFCSELFPVVYIFGYCLTHSTMVTLCNTKVYVLLVVQLPQLNFES